MANAHQRAPDFRKNQIVTMTIDDLDRRGAGIGHVDGYTLFVKDAVPGDQIRAVITKVGRSYGYAHLQEILIPSKDRVEPPCPHAKRCGGCTLMAMSYEAQLRWKEKTVREMLVRIARIPADEIDRVMKPICGEEPFRYRNKMQVPVGIGDDGEPVTGFYADRSHTIVPFSDCLIGHPAVPGLLSAIRSFMVDHHITPYDEKTGKGLIRHVLIRMSADERAHICLVINGPQIPEKDALKERLLAAANEEGIRIDGIAANINTTHSNVILGKETKVIAGKEVLKDRLSLFRAGLSLEFEIAPAAFYQVNRKIAEEIYDEVLSFADLTGSETVLDMYCGIGTMTLFLASRAGEAIGIEIVPEAVANARKNAEINGINNVRFIEGRAEDLAGADLPHADVIVVDPPRKGCDGTLLRTIIAMQPDKIIYVSCDPATLARDLRELAAGGYTLTGVRAFDQFAMTGHVETVALMSRKDT